MPLHDDANLSLRCYRPNRLSLRVSGRCPAYSYSGCCSLRYLGLVGSAIEHVSNGSAIKIITTNFLINPVVASSPYDNIANVSNCDKVNKRKYVFIIVGSVLCATFFETFKEK